MTEISMAYPVSLSIDYPDRPLNRLTTFFRFFTVIPILIILASLSGGDFVSPFAQAYAADGDGLGGGQGASQFTSGVGLIGLSTLLMILFRQKYPRWWFDWNVALTKFSLRVWAYFMLLSDEYPSTDEDQAVHVEIPYPDVRADLNRWLPLVKWLLALPHYVVLFFLGRNYSAHRTGSMIAAGM